MYLSNGALPDSSVATSMLTKHAAPPRLMRWGMELGSYLPHLRISYRKGADNGLADLLSRYPAFRKFTSLRHDTVELPDDYFDKIGDAPLFASPSAGKERRNFDGDKSYLNASMYELYDPKVPSRVPPNFWCSHGAPGHTGRRLALSRSLGIPRA